MTHATSSSLPSGIEIQSIYLMPTGIRARLTASGAEYVAEGGMPFAGALLFYSLDGERFFSFWPVPYTVVARVELPHEKMDWIRIVSKSVPVMDLEEEKIVSTLVEQFRNQLAL